MEIHARQSAAYRARHGSSFKVPKVIAHRGYAAQYPENTLLSLHQAIKAGACFVEFDVQFTADGVPVVLHDDLLKRTTGAKGSVLELPYSEVKTFQACETKRFGAKFANQGIGIPALSDAIFLLKDFPHVHGFVEIKTETLAKFGIEKIIKALIKVIEPAIDQVSVISYDALAIRCARAMGARTIGWVLKEWNNDVRSAATALTPDYLFCNIRKIPPTVDQLWPGPWQWALYDIDDPEIAVELANYGVDLVETSLVSELLQHPVMRLGGCFDQCAA